MTKDVKLFTLAGTSTVQGITTFRVANGNPAVRTGILRRAGQTNIEFLELPHPMSRADAVAFLEAQGKTGIVPAKRKLSKALASIEAAKVAAAEAKIKAKRERDAARKREKRAALKVEVGVDADRELAGMDTGD